MNVNGNICILGSDILDIDVFLYASEILFEDGQKFPDLEFIGSEGGLRCLQGRDIFEH